MKELLRFENVSYHYHHHDGRQALDHLSVSLKQGERIAVLGSNGAGKSTFFRLANGVFVPSEGTIFLEGLPVGPKEKHRMQLRHKVGLVFQDPDVQLLAGTVEEEISFGPMNLGLSPGRGSPPGGKCNGKSGSDPLSESRPAIPVRRREAPGGHCGRSGDGTGDYAVG